MLNRLSMKNDVHQALDTLTPREKQVVVLRFGLEDGRIRTLQEIGNIMGVSRERIRQIESGAFRKLRSKKRVKALKDYLVPVGNWWTICLCSIFFSFWIPQFFFSFRGFFTCTTYTGPHVLHNIRRFVSSLVFQGEGIHNCWAARYNWNSEIKHVLVQQFTKRKKL